MSKSRLAVETILLSIEKIEIYTTSHKDADAFYHDIKSFDACMIHFINMGEMIDRIDTKTKQDYPTLPYREVKDFRNLVAHNYFGIDAEEIWDIITNHLPSLKRDATQILKQMEDKNE